MKIKMKNLKQGDVLILNNGDEVTISEIVKKGKAFRYGKTDISYYVRFKEYPCISLKYNHYGNVVGRFSDFSIKEKVEPEPLVTGDYVAIDIPLKRFGCDKYRRLVRDCFGVRDNELPNIRTAQYDSYNRKETFICNHVQFSNFIMYRNMRDIQNLIKELNARPVEVFTHQVTIHFVAEN